MPVNRIIRPTGISTMIKGYLRGEGPNNGVVILDESSYHNIIGSVGSGCITSTTKYKFGKSSMKFTGYNTTCGLYFAASTNFTIGTSPFSISVWFNCANTGHNQTIFTPGGSNRSNTFIITFSSTNHVVFYSETAIRIDSGAITNDVWHYLVVTGNGSEIKMYIDGAQVGSTYTVSYNYSQYNNYLGYNPDAAAMETLGGYIDEFIFYKGVVIDGTKVQTRSLI